ncbi:MAG: hypothetical protein HZA54_01130 [Planctomycetes bacterium]|nr:hypothetical protein [Planctomycetota bacterium]
MRVLRVGTGLLALALGASGLGADTIVLNDGRSLSGEIQDQTKESVRLKTTKGISVSFKMADVKSVERGAAGAAAGKPGPAGSPGSAPATIPDPVAARFAPCGTAALDGARAESLRLLRDFEKATAALAASPAGQARVRADSVRARARTLEKQVADSGARREELAARYEAQSPGCTGGAYG